MKQVILSRKAYRTILSEVYEHVETETGGILLGHRDGDVWYVLESVEPGVQSIFTETYFEYDEAYVNYRANKLNRAYRRPLELLGLWHRHPGLLKRFSSTDDETNRTYARQLDGAISGIVTLGHGFEITMCYVPQDLRYEHIRWIVAEDQIPAEYLALHDADHFEQLLEAEVKKRYPRSSSARENGGTWETQQPRRHSHGPVQFLKNRLHPGGSVPAAVPAPVPANSTPAEDSRLRDLNLLLDAAEPEVEFLRQSEAGDRLQAVLRADEAQDGRLSLVLEITDLRREGMPRTLSLRFFLSDGQVHIKHGSRVIPCESGVLREILGGIA